MGKYDEIEGIVICPYCKEKTIINIQIKWLSYPLRSFKTYHISEDIPCVDGVYTGASTVRHLLADKCEHCNQTIEITARVLNGKLDAIVPVNVLNKE